MSILVVGSVALDTVETPFGRRRDVLGGSATYFSIAASFFTDVNIVAAVGSDFPERYVKMLSGRGIGTEGLTVSKGKTFRWEGRYDFDLNTAHTISTHLNVFQTFDPRIPEGLKDPRILFLANIDPDIQYGVLNQVRRPELVACDSMNYWISTKRKSLLKLLKKIDIMLLNDAEARQLSGDSNLAMAAKSVLSMGPKAVIIKRGEYGVLFFSKKTHFIAPAYLLEKISDPTGAGDTFAGGMMGYLGFQKKINDAAVRKSIIYGSIMASFTVEDFSVNRLVRLKRRDVSRRFDHYRSITSF